MRFTKYNNPNKRKRRKALSYDEKLARAGADLLFLQSYGMDSKSAENYVKEKYNMNK